MAKKLTTSGFIQRAIAVNGDNFDYSLVSYENSHKKITIVCPIHGQFAQTPNSHLNGSGCPKCGPSKKLNTMVKKYGVEYTLQSKSLQDKKKQTMLERHGVEYSGQSVDIRNKAIETWISNYGADNPFKNIEVQQKQRTTNLNRYGTEYPSQLKDIRDRRVEFNLLKYGTNYPHQKHMVDSLVLLEDKDWMVDQHLVQKHTASVIANQLHVDISTVCNYLHRHGIDVIKTRQTSDKSSCWLLQLATVENINILPEFQIWSTRYRADGYCPETNTIYEFYGDYWHGNPKIYQPDFYNKSLYKTMGELYQKTMERENKIKELGYNLVVMWESDF